MKRVERWGEFLREAVAAARSQPVVTVLTFLLIAGMCAAVCLTEGKSVGSTKAVISSVDGLGTRSIVITASAGAGITSSVVRRIGAIRGISWVGAFSDAEDIENIEFPGGTLVPVRRLWTPNPRLLGIPSDSSNLSSAIASSAALQQLGMVDGTGEIGDGSGETFSVTATLKVPPYLSFLEPLVVVPQSAATIRTVSLVVIVAQKPALVDAVAGAVSGVLGAVDPSKVQIATSSSLARLRGIIQTQLNGTAQFLTGGIFALTAMLLAVVLWGLALSKRKDFGRRRALGATRGFVVGMRLLETGLVAVAASASGDLCGVLILVASRSPLPGPDYFVAVGLLAAATGLVAAVLPAFIAAGRDPIRELRVP